MLNTMLHALYYTNANTMLIICSNVHLMTLDLELQAGCGFVYCIQKDNYFAKSLPHRVAEYSMLTVLIAHFVCVQPCTLKCCLPL